VKTAFCLAVAIFCMTLVEFAVLFLHGIGVWGASEGDNVAAELFQQFQLEQQLVADRMGTIAFGYMWLAIGFSVGQICTLIMKKTVVAFVIAMIISFATAALWLPSMFGGGLTLWLVLPTPFVLLAATRFFTWAWMTGRLGSLHSLLSLMVWLALGIVCMVGTLAYRVAEVPSAGELFDAQGFASRLSSPKRSEAEKQFRAAMQDFGRTEIDETAVHFRLGRAWELQDARNHEEALDHLIAVLAIRRYLDSGLGADFEQERGWRDWRVLEVFDEWLRGLDRKQARPQLLRKALAALQQHESERPPLSDAIKERYLALRHRLDDPGYVYQLVLRGWSSSFREMWGTAIPAAVHAPWENMRRRRILRAVFAGYLQACAAS